MCERRGKSYPLRLRRTANVKRLIERLFTRQDRTRATQASQGWQATQDSLKLVGWSKARRVVVLRRRVKKNLALTVKKRGTKGKSEPGQMVLALPADEVQGSAQMWAYTVQVSDVKYELAAIGQRYRDRCDCRACQVSGFDEPQRQWGWGGFTTQDLHRSQLTARAVALIYNGWSWTVRAVSHAGQTMLYLTPTWTAARPQPSVASAWWPSSAARATSSSSA